jgi:Uma2 family endonuclease
MNESVELENEIDEDIKMGSLNHGIVQSQITGLFFTDKRFRAISQLSLDSSQIDLTPFGIKAKKELIPDICVYPNTVKRKRRDVLRMSEMPLLAIEVVSPQQGIEEILAKIDAYFALGIKSCWLVVPSMEVLDIYSQPDQHHTFDLGDAEIIDEVLDIKLPIQEIFG